MNHYDLIHVHTPMGAALGRLAAIKARKKGTKIIVPIDFDAIKAIYNAKLEMAIEEENAVLRQIWWYPLLQMQ